MKRPTTFRGKPVASICVAAALLLVSCNYLFRLKITVPKNYEGEVILVLSNLSHDVLKVDSNGIGYVTKKTFDEYHLKPVVVDANGVNLDDRCIGFNNAAFWAKGTYSEAVMAGEPASAAHEINYISFKIAPVRKTGWMPPRSADLYRLVDTSKLYHSR